MMCGGGERTCSSLTAFAFEVLSTLLLLFSVLLSHFWQRVRRFTARSPVTVVPKTPKLNGREEKAGREANWHVEKEKRMITFCGLSLSLWVSGSLLLSLVSASLIGLVFSLLCNQLCGNSSYLPYVWILVLICWRQWRVTCLWTSGVC